MEDAHPNVDSSSTLSVVGSRSAFLLQGHLFTWSAKKKSTMKLAILAALAASATAFAPETSSRGSTALKAGMDDLKAIAEKSNPVLKVSVFLPIEWRRRDLCSSLLECQEQAVLVLN